MIGLVAFCGDWTHQEGSLIRQSFLGEEHDVKKGRVGEIELAFARETGRVVGIAREEEILAVIDEWTRHFRAFVDAKKLRE